MRSVALILSLMSLIRRSDLAADLQSSLPPGLAMKELSDFETDIVLVRQYLALLEDNVNLFAAKVQNFEQRMSEVVNQMKKESSSNKTIIAFTAIRPSSGDLTAGRKIIFLETLLNEGDGFDLGTSVFVTPVYGLYQFSAQFCNLGQRYAAFGIVHEGTVVAKSVEFQNVGSSCTTTTALVKAQAGDQVFLKVMYTGKIVDDRSRRSAFMGMLLDAM